MNHEKVSNFTGMVKIVDGSFVGLMFNMWNSDSWYSRLATDVFFKRLFNRQFTWLVRECSVEPHLHSSNVACWDVISLFNWLDYF